MASAPDLLICVACGTQYPDTEGSGRTNCFICDDPRQYVPPTGQAWTTLGRLRAGGYKNRWTRDEVNPRIWSISTEPKVGIGQRAMLLETDEGNVLWDCIAFLDGETIGKIAAMGGLRAIVISHPHFYTTHLEWGKSFGCPVYTSAEDEQWLAREDTAGIRKHITGDTQEIVPGVKAIKTGGHFDGSLVLLWEKERELFTADSLMTIPSAHSPADRQPGIATYSFMWSIPNMIPLPPSKIQHIWHAVRPYDFTATHGLMLGMDVRDADIKSRVLESVKIQVRAMGHTEHEVLEERWP